MAKLWDARSDVRTSTIEAIVQLATHGEFESLNALSLLTFCQRIFAKQSRLLKQSLPL